MDGYGLKLMKKGYVILRIRRYIVNPITVKTVTAMSLLVSSDTASMIFPPTIVFILHVAVARALYVTSWIHEAMIDVMTPAVYRTLDISAMSTVGVSLVTTS